MTYATYCNYRVHSEQTVSPANDYHSSSASDVLWSDAVGDSISCIATESKDYDVTPKCKLGLSWMSQQYQLHIIIGNYTCIYIIAQLLLRHTRINTINAKMFSWD